MFSTIIKLVFLLYALFFLLGSIFAPIIASSGEGHLADKLYFIFAHTCHQQPDRTFWLANYPVALCSRCLGLYLGFVIYMLINIFTGKILKLKHVVYIFIIGLTEGLLEIFTSFQGSNIIRFFSGIAIGVFIVSILDCLIKMIGGKVKCLVLKKL